MVFSISCRGGQPMIISQPLPTGFSDEMAANRQLARHAIPKNQNAFDEEVTKSTVKCYHSPARTRGQESWKQEKNEGTWKPGSDSYARSTADRAEKTHACDLTARESPELFIYLLCQSVANWAYLKIGAAAAAAFSHVSYTREEIDSLFFIQRARSRDVLPVLF